MIKQEYKSIKIKSLIVKDIRFKQEEMGLGSDASNPHTDYSNPYLILQTGEIMDNQLLNGIGIGFTLGKGNDMICQAVIELKNIILGLSLYDIISEFSVLVRKLTNPLQSRWIGPVSGPYYMAAGVIINAIFDLWAKVEKKPLWKLLVDINPNDLVSMLDMRYVSHLISENEILEILTKNSPTKAIRETELIKTGLPSYFTTWIGYDSNILIDQIQEFKKDKGFDTFKIKVGLNLKVDQLKLEKIRNYFPNDISILTDANQKWSVSEAIHWMKSISEFNIEWIEEPVAPDLIDGHKIIKDELESLGIDVVTGENCPNSHIAGQMLSQNAVSRFQIDSCRVVGPLENIIIMLIAAKYKIPICPHAGGSGLDELVPHLAAWNYICCNPSLEKVIVEQVGFCSHHFIAPSEVNNGHIILPEKPGYIIGIKEESLIKYEYPQGIIWK